MNYNHTYKIKNKKYIYHNFNHMTIKKYFNLKQC